MLPCLLLRLIAQSLQTLAVNAPVPRDSHPTQPGSDDPDVMGFVAPQRRIACPDAGDAFLFPQPLDLDIHLILVRTEHDLLTLHEAAEQQIALALDACQQLSERF